MEKIFASVSLLLTVLLSGWAPVEIPDLHAARQWATAAPLPNSGIFVVGGWEAGQKTAGNAEIYNPVKNEWTTQEMPVIPYCVATALKDGRILLVQRTFSFVYNPKDGKLKQVKPVAPRIMYTVTPLQDGKFLIVGGRDKELKPVSICEIFDPATDSFKATSSLKEPRAMHSATLLKGGAVLVTGGMQGVGAHMNQPPMASSEVFDPATGQWSSAGNMQTARSWHQSRTLSDGTALVIGGWDGSRNGIALCEVYDPKSKTWSQSDPLSIGRYDAASVVLENGDVMVIAGATRESQPGLNTCEIYSVKDKKWAAGQNLKQGRRAHTVVAQPNRVVVIAGASRLQEPINSVEVITIKTNAPR